MRESSHTLRLIAPTALMSLVLAVLCTTVAVSLYRQQEVSAAVLGENIVSRQAAADLMESLYDLAALHRNRVEQVEPILNRIQEHIETIGHYADKPEESQHFQAVAAAFGRYQAAHRAGGAGGPAKALAVLETELVPRTQDLRTYNAEQLRLSEQEHRMGIRAMAWRLAGIGLAASLAGLVLGYGVTRGLRRSIHQLRVRVQDAADKLGYDLPPVVWNDGGGLDDLQVRMQSVVRQIESVVQSLQQRERELLRAEQLAAVGQLAAGVAHEVRNPLTSIKMLVQAGGESGAAGLAGEDLAVVEREIRRIERSLQTFLDFARPPRLERKPHDLNPLIERMLDLIRGRAHKQRIALDYRPPAAPIVGDVDAEQLHQVLINLALNALDVMPHGGRLHVGLERSADGAAEIALSDTGPGIADTLLPRLFEPFVSGKETGLGLGLVVSRRIVEDHGGTLRGGNRREGGARFAIRLPAAAPARAAS